METEHSLPNVDIRSFSENDRLLLREIYLDTRRQAFDWLDTSVMRVDDFDRDTEGGLIWVAERQISWWGLSPSGSRETSFIACSSIQRPPDRVSVRPCCGHVFTVLADRRR